MQECALKELVRTIQQSRCEFQTIEVKTAQYGCPLNLRTTLSSFSNQDEGGIIIFGLSEQDDRAVVGVYDAQDLQQRVVAQCNEMQMPVRPLFTVVDIDGKQVVSAEIPSADMTMRPVYYRGSGKHSGSYVRVGDADEPMTEDEIYSWDAYRSRIRDDRRPIAESTRTMLRPGMIDRYLEEVKKERPNIASHATDDEILTLMGIMSDGVATLSGLLVFGKYPQGFFPQLSITAVVVPGTKMGDITESHARFLANERLDGTIEEMLDGALSFIERNMRMRTIIDEKGRSFDEGEFPLKAVREIVLNALIHRDYSIHTEGTPITIRMFSDRMEVTNKGGLFGRNTIEILSRTNPDTRNPHLATILEVLHIAENRCSGIPTIKAEMEKAGLPPPVFFSQRGEFTVTLYNTPVGRATAGTLTEQQKSLIDFCKTPRSRAQVIDHIGLSHSYAITKVLQPLIDQALVKLTIPDRPSSSKQRFYTD
jgi:ATP-dependent DNA helicase RecG